MTTFASFTTHPEDYGQEEILEAYSGPRKERWPRCYFCGYTVGPDEASADHHPARDRYPDWTEPAHADCHARFHSRNGDY